MQKSMTKKLCLSAVMAAFYVGFDYLATVFSSVFSGTIKISLSGFPIIIAAIVAGPIWGMASGFVGAFIGQMITYGFTATTLLWVLPAVIRGAATGLLFIAFKRSCKTYILAVETVISSLLVTTCNTFVMYVDSKLYNYYSYAYVFGGLIPRILSGIITAVVFAVLLPPIIKVLKKNMKI